MKTYFAQSALAILSFMFVGCGSSAGNEESTADGAQEDAVSRDDALSGNGAPSGAHYNLNIIGVSKGKSVDSGGSNGHVMFVPLTGTTKISLSEGTFDVIDADGTDGAAAFQLPNPDPDGDGVTTYSVFARVLGKPGGSGSMTACATDPSTGEVYCNTSLQLIRTGGKQQFSNVTKSLLYVAADLNRDGKTEMYSLFSDALEDYYWEYDNNGMKLVQLRFYEVSTNINQ